MLPRPRVPYQGGMPPARYMNPMQGRPSFGPMMGGAPQMRPRGGGGSGGGGLLSKLLGRGNQGGQLNAAGRTLGAAGARGAGSGGGFLKTLSNPSAISGFLSNTQKVLSTAQQIGPMVQQYGPIVKNLPAMWKLYRGLKNVPSETEESKTADDNTQAEAKPKSATQQNKKKKKKPAQPVADVQNEVEDHQEEKRETATKARGTSKPKLYI